MAKLSTLKKHAKESAELRGHKLSRWTRKVVTGNRETSLSLCVHNCGAWVQVNTLPEPNGIDIGGPAVAINCGDKAN